MPSGLVMYCEVNRPRPNISPPRVAVSRGPSLSCIRPAKIIVIENAIVETVNGMAASVLDHFHFTTSALPMTDQA